MVNKANASSESMNELVGLAHFGMQENIQIEKILIHCIIFSGRPKLKDIADHIFDILENSFNAEANEVVLK